MLNNIKLFVFLCIFTSCAPVPNQVRGLPGKDGMNGIDGINGVDGVNGADGEDGHSSLVNIYPATEEQCENGGTVIVSALDINDSFTIDEEDLNPQMGVVCNGADAPVVPMQTIEVVTPCADGNPNRQVVIKLPTFEALTITSDGAQYKKPRMVTLLSGTYTTNDGLLCTYTIVKTPSSLTITW